MSDPVNPKGKNPPPEKHCMVGGTVCFKCEVALGQETFTNCIHYQKSWATMSLNWDRVGFSLSPSPPSYIDPSIRVSCDLPEDTQVKKYMDPKAPPLYSSVDSVLGDSVKEPVGKPDPESYKIFKSPYRELKAEIPKALSSQDPTLEKLPFRRSPEVFATALDWKRNLYHCPFLFIEPEICDEVKVLLAKYGSCPGKNSPKRVPNYFELIKKKDGDDS